MRAGLRFNNTACSEATCRQHCRLPQVWRHVSGARPATSGRLGARCRARRDLGGSACAATTTTTVSTIRPPQKLRSQSTHPLSSCLLQFSLCSGLPFREVDATSSSSFSVIESYIDRDAPYSSLTFISLRLAARAAPAAFCWALETAFIVLRERPRHLCRGGIARHAKRAPSSHILRLVGYLYTDQV